ncbi:hypothetical protein [Draconibacterium orientale]|uniref:hypothetical protein n=1 Tax=Draconibacterium orientale TaxID=1168034 RepID=UPI0029C0E630|nr:hypothetical protein [Draconibacterium orientale]
MKQIRLELNSFKILKNRERWQIYFIVYTAHPDDPDKTIIKLVPGGTNIRLKPLADNFHSFKPSGSGADGLKLQHINMPANNYIDVGLVMMQSRKKLRTVVAKLTELKQELNINELKRIKLSRIEWFLADMGFDIVAGILKNIKDRNMGYVSLGEEFNEEFDADPNQKRSNKLSTGEAEINWVWEVKE